MYFCKKCGAIEPRTTKNRKWAEGLPLCWHCKVPVSLQCLNGNSTLWGIPKEDSEKEHTYSSVYDSKEECYKLVSTPVE